MAILVFVPPAMGLVKSLGFSQLHWGQREGGKAGKGGKAGGGKRRGEGGKGAATDGLTAKGLLVPRPCVERQHAVPSYAAATMVSGKQHMKRGGIYSWDSQYKPMYIMPVTHHNHVST